MTEEEREEGGWRWVRLKSVCVSSTHSIGNGRDGRRRRGSKREEVVFKEKRIECSGGGGGREEEVR